MNQKTLIGLAAAAVIAIVAAIVLNHSRRPQSEAMETSATFFPELRDHVNEISKLVVTGADNKTLATLQGGANGWTVLEKGGYPADTGKLREFLLKLADAKPLEQKTSNKDKYAALGVEDVAAKDAKGVQVELDGLAQPIKLIVGTPNPHGGTFVRRVDDAPSWLVSATLSVEKNAADWLRKDLADIAATRVASVAITRPDGSSVRIAKTNAGDANYTVADVPKGREAGNDFAVNGLASALAGLRFDDVLASKDAAPGDKPLKARYTTFDGVVIEATAWEKDGKNYAQFVATFDPAQADKGIMADQAKTKADFDVTTAAAEAAKKDAKPGDNADAPAKPLALTDPAKDREARLAALNKEVTDLNAHFNGWTYVLPAYKYANMNKSIGDLLKPLEDKKSADAQNNPLPAKPGKMH